MSGHDDLVPIEHPTKRGIQALDIREVTDQKVRVLPTAAQPWMLPHDLRGGQRLAMSREAENDHG
jgi:hypothetical protein